MLLTSLPPPSRTSWRNECPLSFPIRQRRPLLYAALLLGVLGALGAGAWALLHLGVIRIANDQGDYVFNTDDPEIVFSVSKGGVVLDDRKSKRKYNLKVVGGNQAVGEHELEVTDLDADLSFKTKSFTIKRGERVALKAWFERKEVAAKPAADKVKVTGEKALPKGTVAVVPLDDAWLKQVAALPAEKQVEAVAAKLKERNPGFDGKMTHKSKDGIVTELRFVTDKVTDLAPVRALPGLTSLGCSGTGLWSGRLADLAPLQDMKLTQLNCDKTAVSDLAPLKGMKLIYLECSYTKVSDLAPLKDMPLTGLILFNTAVSDLAPLQDMKLTILGCGSTKVADLAPLKSMPLTLLIFNSTKVADLAPLKGMPLTILDFDDTKVADLAPLQDMKLIDLRCGNTNVADLGPLKDMPLTSLIFNATKVTDLSPLKDMKLTSLGCSTTNISDLAPLKGMPLTSLYFSDTKVADLAPLKGMPLKTLNFDDTKVTDLSLLKDMRLTSLSCSSTEVADLAPLKGMSLKYLNFDGTQVTDLSPLKGMPLRELRCDFKRERDAEILRSIKTLETINRKPVAEFWKEVDKK
jgi:Leucine-rich repeat (LRR) protein